MLEADLQAPQAASHSASHLVPLREEHPDCSVAEVTVRRYVQETNEG